MSSSVSCCHDAPESTSAGHCPGLPRNHLARAQALAADLMHAIRLLREPKNCNRFSESSQPPTLSLAHPTYVFRCFLAESPVRWPATAEAMPKR